MTLRLIGNERIQVLGREFTYFWGKCSQYNDVRRLVM